MPNLTRTAASWVDNTARNVEWHELLERIAQRTAGRVAAERLRELMPAVGIEAARRRCQVVADALELAEGAPLPGVAVEELDGLLARLERGAVAGAGDLASLRALLRTAAGLRSYATRHREQHPALAEEIATDPSLDTLLAKLEHALDEDGTVADRASDELADARRRVASIRKELSTRIDRLVARYSEVLRDAYYAERDGRYVLPVRADAHRRVPGIVLGSSASGGTLYVEPQEITELGNRLGVAEAAAEREEARVLAALSTAAAALGDELARAYEACLGADQLSAIASWARDVDAVVIAPEPDAGIELHNVRHPLLIGGGTDVVPNDIRIEPGAGLVISGPNAGGKTVALKCLGLAAWMARAGIPLPAEPRSRVGWFDEVLTDVGDDQSLARSLSTFSAHVDKLARFVEQADRRTLVLLDEVAAGTDPEEGSALAVAVLEELVRRGAAVAVTTHYERLKELPTHNNRFTNASVGFDMQAMAPTFKLKLGVPGASSALAVAARYGMPPGVLERAEELVPEHARRREELVEQLQAEERALEQARREAEAEARRQKQLGVEVETELLRERERERERAARQARELTVEVQRARAELRQARARLKQAGLDKQGVREAEQSVSRAAQQIAIGGRLVQVADAPRRAPAPPEPLAAEELAAGTRVYVPGIEAVAEVLGPPSKGQVRVVAGALKLSVPVASLQRAEKGKRAKREAPKRTTTSAMRGEHVPVRTGDNTLDLRGERVDEALERVDAFVDRLLAEGEPAGFVLHGHGTGALKSAVRRHLADSRYVSRSRAADPEDGGDAFTVLWIAD